MTATPVEPLPNLHFGELGADLSLFEELRSELEMTQSAILQIRERPLLQDNPVLQRAIQLRNPYVGPLSLIQIALLSRSDDGDEVARVLGATLNGVAQGLRNTG